MKVHTKAFITHSLNFVQLALCVFMFTKSPSSCLVYPADVQRDACYCVTVRKMLCILLYEIKKEQYKDMMIKLCW